VGRRQSPGTFELPATRPLLPATFTVKPIK